MRNLQTRYVEPPVDAIYPKETENLIAWNRTASGRVVTLTVRDETNKSVFNYFYTVNGTHPRYDPTWYTLVMRKNGRLIFTQSYIQRGGRIPEKVIGYLAAPSKYDLVKGLSNYHW